MWSWKTQKQCWDLEPLAQCASLLLLYIYEPIYLFTSLLFTDLCSLALKAEQPHKDVWLITLCGPVNREPDSSVWRETSYYVMTTERAGQVRGEMNRWPRRELQSVPVTTGLLMNSSTHGQCIWWPLVSLGGQQKDVSFTQSALISWPVEAGKQYWCYFSGFESILGHEAWKYTNILTRS